MLPYPRGIVVENTPNYGIVKTETVFGFTSRNNQSDSFNTTEPLEWILTNSSFQTSSLQANKTDEKALLTRESKDFKLKQVKNNKKVTTRKGKKSKGKKVNSAKGKHRESKKVNKCIIKFLKKGGGQQQQMEDDAEEAFSGKKRKRNRRAGMQKMKKKYMMPIILGFLAAKSILIPIALKALAFMSAKGLMLGFFSTVMASVISLKGMFNQHHDSQKRNDDSKTQVEIIQIPTKSEDHVYYDDDHHYRRGDNLIPLYAPDFEHVMVPNDNRLVPNGVQVLNKRGKYVNGNVKVNKHH